MPSARLRACLLANVFLFGAAALDAAEDPPAKPPTPEQEKFFESHVRPVLVQHCYACHGPKKQESGLRLDSRVSLLAGGDLGPAIVPGDVEKSLLVAVIRKTGDVKMPPEGKLSDQAVAALTEWVKQGAPWPADKVIETPSSPAAMARARREHWAFRPVANPPLPAVKAEGWAADPIDRFILAKLEARGLAPSPEADRRTLLRRATFDLIGLPPTPEELAEFEADTSPEAFAKVVDRLLASPHYGERWGRYWLDVARYADTKGYVFFQENNFSWPYTYRDYVIRSLNADVPYDRFVLEQLAADRLKDASPAALAGMGYLTVGGRFMNNPHDILDDRIDVVTRGLLGLTVTCARCHDHKFDPIPAADYYSLYGVFASSVEPEVPPLLAPPPDTEQYRTFERELRAREAKLSEFVSAKHHELVASARSRAAEYVTAAHALRNQPKIDDFMLLADGGDLNPKMIRRWQVYLDRTARKHDRVWAPWHEFTRLKAETFAVDAAVICARYAEPSADRPLNPLVARSLALKPPKTLDEAAERYGLLLGAADKLWQGKADFAMALGEPPPGPLEDPAQEELRQVLYGPDTAPNVSVSPFGDLDLLPDRPSQGKLQELRKAVETYRATGPGAPPRAMSLEDSTEVYEPRVFLRGNPQNLGEAASRAFLQILSPTPRPVFREGSGRLELARAIVDPQNPLTARVLVNRVWAHHFGRGLVATPSDFGVRSEPPSHPELLDHLAHTFVEQGWSLKRLHRRMMLSATYRQQSLDRADLLAADPENRLLGKMNRQRLDFEATRDALLAVSGRLDRTAGGPSANLFTAPFPPRRTVYGFIDRLNLPGVFRTFDFPSPDTTSPARDTTTVAPQALFLMNNPQVFESARKLVERKELAGEPDFSRKVERLYRLLFVRMPTADEQKLAERYFGEGKTVATNWERYAHALMLTNEFVFVD